MISVKGRCHFRFCPFTPPSRRQAVCVAPLGTARRALGPCLKPWLTHLRPFRLQPTMPERGATDQQTFGPEGLHPPLQAKGCHSGFSSLGSSRPLGPQPQTSGRQTMAHPLNWALRGHRTVPVAPSSQSLLKRFASSVGHHFLS